jgi:hypothetical protein
MILTHESGSQEDQFDEKNGGKKSRGTIPLSSLETLKKGCPWLIGATLLQRPERLLTTF